jgi:Rrf2 family protein
MISQTAEYALRAAVWMAHVPESCLTTQQIAEATRVPPGYLSKVLQALGRAGLVTSQRGLRGGFTLARGPEEVSVLEVINAVDPIKRIRECPLSLESHGKKLCPLHSRLDEAMAGVEKVLADSTLAELVADSGGARPLCEDSNTAGAEPL